MADSLSSIIDACQGGERPEYDDLRYAVCALQALQSMDFSDDCRMAGARSPIDRLRSEEKFNRRKRAYAKPPKQWLGVDNDPDRQEVQERRRVSLAVLDRVRQKADA